VHVRVLSGLFKKHGALATFLTDTLEAMTKSRQLRQLSETSKQFYVTLYQHGGSALHDWVSSLFLGPARSTTTAEKARAPYPFGLGLLDTHFANVKTMLDKWKLSDAPCIVSEDGTAIQMRLDIVERDSKILVFGLSGGSFEVKSLADLKIAATKRSLASTLYVYTLVPLVRGAPHIPIFAFCHDNSNDTFSTDLVMAIWKYIWQVECMMSVMQWCYNHN
jgi:hypothetical protein